MDIPYFAHYAGDPPHLEQNMKHHFSPLEP